MNETTIQDGKSGFLPQFVNARVVDWTTNTRNTVR